MRKIALIISFFLSAFCSHAEILKPVKWTFEAKKTAVPNEYDLILKAKIEKGWHLYSQFLIRDDGPVKTSFTFKESANCAKLGITKEISKVHKTFDPNFNMELLYFEKEAVFIQKVKVTDPGSPITGTLNYMVCNDRMCLPPDDVAFSFSLADATPNKGDDKKDPSLIPKGDISPPGKSGVGAASPFNVENKGTASAAIPSGILRPVKWIWEVKKVSEGTFELIFNAKIDNGWHLYGMNIPAAGPQPVSIELDNNAAYTLDGKPMEISKATEIDDPVLGMKLSIFEKEAQFHVLIRQIKEIDSISGTIHFSSCDSTKCLPPEKVHFAFHKEELKAAPHQFSISGSLWQIFLGGFLGGMAALLTPCVFPMIPLTVSFFTKKKDTKSEGIGKALLFGFSIILIYVSIGFLVTKLFGANTLNSMASNVYFNLAFFVIFFVFALSFLGAFEITLPASWTNKADQQSEKGGLIGIFFMAFTLALVSFSCTGPIVGQLLVIAALGGGYSGPIIGMFGFSLALALPFTLFAIFPSWMSNLPKSGGWLNSVKVVLGFIELALSLKFLSLVDLTYHWDFLKREYFLVIWIVIFALMGFYLLGKIKFSHDTDQSFVSIPRLMLAILSFAFSIYMIPGLWGAPVNLLSGIAPPNEYTEGSFTGGAIAASNEKVNLVSNSTKKYAAQFKCPYNLDCYFDYDEALAASKKEHKPIMIDFTGHACVNCRKMENTVWHDPRVLNKLKNDYILVSLYVDDKTDLEANEAFKSPSSGNKISTLGEKWSDLQASRFNTNSQPYYVLIDSNEKLLGEPTGYDPSVDKYVNFLELGKAEYQKRNIN
jgi:thiol:disulfide interchange protein